MTDQTLAPPKAAHILDHTLPIYVVLQQTPGKNLTTYFQGETALHDATALAESIAVSTKRFAIVFGPQDAVYGPPPVVATQVRLSFGG